MPGIQKIRQVDLSLGENLFAGFLTILSRVQPNEGKF